MRCSFWRVTWLCGHTAHNPVHFTRQTHRLHIKKLNVKPRRPSLSYSRRPAGGVRHVLVSTRMHTYRPRSTRQYALIWYEFISKVDFSFLFFFFLLRPCFYVFKLFILTFPFTDEGLKWIQLSVYGRIAPGNCSSAALWNK